MVHGIVVISFNEALSTQSCTFVFLSDFQILHVFLWLSGRALR